jgi:hypothetical protein
MTVGFIAVYKMPSDEMYVADMPVDDIFED